MSRYYLLTSARCMARTSSLASDGPFELFTPMVDLAISRFTFLLAVGDYPVRGEIKQRWIELCSEAAICDDPKRMDELSEAITDLLEQEKQRIQAAHRTMP
jgi:hypothetical protein